MTKIQKAFSGPRRFIDAGFRFDEFRQSAQDYVDKLTPRQKLGLWQKPLDWNHRHPSFFNAMYQLLNVIQIMDLKPESTIVEVGSGSGWATEILAGLKYRVICLEPSEAMIEAAKKRVLGFLESHKMQQLAHNVTWHCVTFEESTLEDGSADAVLFFESFHHLIREDEATEKAYNVLRDGGVLCIIGDSNWMPGNSVQETSWKEEMAAFGTLESPFTHQYLTHTLEKAGFSGVVRHHCVNALIPTEREGDPVAAFVTIDARWVNLFVAFKNKDAKNSAQSPNSSSSSTRNVPEALARDVTRPDELVNGIVEESHDEAFPSGLITKSRDTVPTWARPVVRRVWRKFRRIMSGF